MNANARAARQARTVRSDPKRSASARAATLANRKARAYKAGALRTTHNGSAR